MHSVLFTILYGMYSTFSFGILLIMNCFWIRLEQGSVLLMTTKGLLRTKMMLAEICTGNNYN